MEHLFEIGAYLDGDPSINVIKIEKWYNMVKKTL